jgi:hypothetical protein
MWHQYKCRIEEGRCQVPFFAFGFALRNKVAERVLKVEKRRKMTEILKSTCGVELVLL